MIDASSRFRVVVGVVVEVVDGVEMKFVVHEPDQSFAPASSRHPSNFAPSHCRREPLLFLHSSFAFSTGIVEPRCASLLLVALSFCRTFDGNHEESSGSFYLRNGWVLREFRQVFEF